MLKIDALPQNLKQVVREWVRLYRSTHVTRIITKKAMREIIKTVRGSMTIPSAVDAAIAAYEQIRDLPYSNKCRLPVCNMRRVKTYEGTPIARLNVLREHDVLGAYNHVVDKHSRGGWIVHLDSVKVGVRQDTRTLSNMRRCRWAVHATDTYITVPPQWRTRVMRRGLAICDGIMTLDAHQIDATGCELYSAVWVRKTTGKTVITESGYIARIGGTTYHAATIDGALSGVVKKAKQKQLDAKLSISDLQKLINQCSDVPVYLSDAVRVGACDPGIRHWCSRVGIDLAAEKNITLQRMYDCYVAMPMPEARSTILRVLRRNRSKLVVC